MFTLDDEKRIAEIRATREQNPETQARKKAVAIYAALQPYSQGSHNNGNILEKIVTARVLAGQPIPFIAFWGVGGKRLPDHHDEKLLSEMEAIRISVSTIYPEGGTHIQLLLADEHGLFNRFTKPQTYEYLVRIQDRAIQKNIGAIWLSDLYQKWELSVPDIGNPMDQSAHAVSLWTHSRYSRQREQLIESAKRHHQVGENPEQIAYSYAVMRLSEADLLAKTFPDTILLINSSKDLAKLLLPQGLPHIYLITPPVWFQKAV